MKKQDISLIVLTPDEKDHEFVRGVCNVLGIPDKNTKHLKDKKEINSEKYDILITSSIEGIELLQNSLYVSLPTINHSSLSDEEKKIVGFYSILKHAYERFNH